MIDYNNITNWPWVKPTRGVGFEEGLRTDTLQLLPDFTSALKHIPPLKHVIWRGRSGLFILARCTIQEKLRHLNRLERQKEKQTGKRHGDAELAAPQRHSRLMTGPKRVPAQPLREISRGEGTRRIPTDPPPPSQIRIIIIITIYLWVRVTDNLAKSGKKPMCVYFSISLPSFFEPNTVVWECNKLSHVYV